jgi:TetR/AcrR family transcriptional regulator, cholesterol catabolism regulator
VTDNAPVMAVRAGAAVGSTRSIVAGTPVLGRRERKKQDTQRRIFEAADALFGRRGYAAVTTQEIAQAADVGAGTLFRYARSKPELLIMVMNERLRLGAERGLLIAEQGGSPAEAILGLIEPLVQAALNQPENTSVFQREVLFGVDGAYRAEALERIGELEDAMVTVLARHAESHPPKSGADPRRVAETIFSVLYLKLVRLGLGRVSPEALPDALRRDIEYLMRELLDVDRTDLQSS